MLKAALLAAAVSAGFVMPAFAADSTSTYERSCYNRHCTTTTESEDSFSIQDCEHGRGGEVKCKTTTRERRIPEPTVENVQVGGKTVNILRGLPR